MTSKEKTWIERRREASNRVWAKVAQDELDDVITLGYRFHNGTIRRVFWSIVYFFTHKYYRKRILRDYGFIRMEKVERYYVLRPILRIVSQRIKGSMP